MSIATFYNGNLVILHQRCTDASKYFNIKGSTLHDRLIYGWKGEDGLTFKRVDYSLGKIIIRKKGKDHSTVTTLQQAGRRTSLSQESVLDLLESGKEERGWSFDEEGAESQPQYIDYNDRTYSLQPSKGYKATTRPFTYLHRDMWQDAHRKLMPMERLRYRDGNRWNITIRNIALY